VDVAKVEDKWIAGSLERCGAGAGLDALRPDAIVSLAQARVPNSRVEDYRFTDLAALVTTKPVAADAAAGDAVDAAAWTLSAADATRVVLVDGVYKPDKSNVSGATGGVTVSTISQGASSEVIGAVASMRGGVFANINAATASDAVVINVPAGAAVGDADPRRPAVDVGGFEGWGDVVVRASRRGARRRGGVRVHRRGFRRGGRVGGWGVLGQRRVRGGA
jgi:Fe-S cluster assembly protein SufD